jgi:hypothetical protein
MSNLLLWNNLGFESSRIRLLTLLRIDSVLLIWVFDFCVDADMEDYGFEYSDEEQEEQDVDIENQYYNSKG